MMKENLEQLVISLTPEEAIQLLRAALDDDREAALYLVRDRLYPRVAKQVDKQQCMPAYEMEARKRDGARDDNPWLDEKSKTTKED